ncbi:acyltransferase [Caldimonas brevitalea]|uniref:Acyltransferase n=2 Tax=Caldimonas brevitalea TaxID=413882 RepID=A0A0G3BII2_9BURK|nr:acyltransferase [Caldimonas brevitalea]
MMWLGIVLHVSVNHMVGESTLPWRDRETTLLADLLLVFIHTFRMPVFFILAGYFAAMLLQRRGPASMLKQRLRRLALPFAVFWPPLFVGMVVLMMVFVHLMARGTLGLDPALMPPPPGGGSRLRTMHLWFLYLLIWFSVLSALWARWSPALPQSLPAALSGLFRRLGTAWWGALVLALPLVLAGAGYKNGIVTPDGSFMPPWAEWLHNGLFFVFGHCLYRYQDEAFEHYRRHVFAYTAAGLLCFVATLLLGSVQQASNPPQGLHLAVAFVYNSASWLWSFALIGAFLRWVPRQNAVLGYLAQSSYWVYLVHMLGTVGFGVLLYGAPLPAVAKLSLNIAATSLACLLSYQWLVRHTFVGRLLDGKPAEGGSKGGKTAPQPAAGA